jgi:hypothetical protein
MNIDLNFKIFRSKLKITIGWMWIRFFVVLAAVLISTSAAYWGSSEILMLLAAVPIAIAGVLLLLKYPNIGFVFALLGGMFLHFYGPSAISAVVIIIAAMLGLWVLDMLVVKRRFEFIKSRSLLPVVVFMVISLVAFGMGQIPWFIFAQQAPLDSQAGGLAIFLLSAGTLIMAAHRFRDERWLRIFMWVFIVLGAMYIVGRTINFPNIDELYNWGFTGGSMFWTWLVAMASSQVVYNPKLKTGIKVLLVLLVGLTFYVAMTQAYDWKSGWLPPLVCVAVILGMRFKRLVILIVPIAVVMVGIIFTVLVATDEYSWGTRVDAWLIVLEISKVNPFLGLGFSNYYWYTPLYSIRGWSVNFNSHSQYIDLIAQVGILGLFCFLWIFAETLRSIWKLVNKLPGGFPLAYSYGTLAGVAGTLLAAFLVDWVLPFVYNIGFAGFRASILPWIFIGGLISIDQLYGQSVETQHAEKIEWQKN